MALIWPDALELLERLDAAVDQVVHARAVGAAGRERGLGIVDQQRVDGVEPEPQQALLVGAHDAVVGVVPDDLHVEPAAPRRAVEGRGDRPGA